SLGAAAEPHLVVPEPGRVPEGHRAARVAPLPPVASLERAVVGDARLVGRPLVDVPGEVVDAVGAGAPGARPARLAPVDALDLLLLLGGVEALLVDHRPVVVDVARVAVADVPVGEGQAIRPLARERPLVAAADALVDAAARLVGV